MAACIKRTRLERFGHVIRMDRTTAAKKKKLELNVKVKEKLRPRLLEDAENDLLALKLKRWKQKANNRQEWAPIVKGAKLLRRP
jgi:hypothetical protein